MNTKTMQIQEPATEEEELATSPGQFWKDSWGRWVVRLETSSGLKTRTYRRKWEAEERSDKAIDREEKIHAKPLDCRFASPEATAEDKTDKAGHTPGPWESWRDSLTDKCQIDTKDGAGTGNGGFAIATFHGPKMEDNARIAAAAPELLSALETAKRMINEVDGHRFAGADLMQINAALKKAKGE